ILESSMQPVYNVIAMLGIVTVLGLGGNNVLSGVWTVGTFSAYVSIFILLTTKASKAAKLFNSYQQGRVSWQRIVPYLAPYQSHDTAAVTAQTEPRLAVQRLTVCYPKTEQPALQNLSFVAQCGEILGVSGPIACGKSTLAAALGGRVAYGGRIR
ncbi:MAG: ABC transporter ATP-binding protein, partial [Pygmaiobacter sp.]